jgi:hypothetical protein
MMTSRGKSFSAQIWLTAMMSSFFIPQITPQTTVQRLRRMAPYNKKSGGDPTSHTCTSSTYRQSLPQRAKLSKSEIAQ